LLLSLLLLTFAGCALVDAQECKSTQEVTEKTVRHCKTDSIEVAR